MLEESGMKSLGVPREYLLDRVTAKDIVDESTGEIALPCNTVITEEVLEKLFELKPSQIETIYTNDLDCGPFISDTLTASIRRSNRAGSPCRNLSHDATRRAADQRSC